MTAIELIWTDVNISLCLVNAVDRPDQDHLWEPLEEAILPAENRDFWKEIVTNVDWEVTKLPFLEDGPKKKKKCLIDEHAIIGNQTHGAANVE